MFQNPLNPITLDAREGSSAALSVRPDVICPIGHREQQQIVSS
jgi:hypothetical protein